MFIVTYFSGAEEITQREYNTLREAENNIYNDSIDCNFYKIYDADKMDVVDEGDIEREGALEMMYPNNENGDEF